MIDQKLLLTDLENCIKKLARKGVSKQDILEAKNLVLEKNKSLLEVESLRQKKNELSNQVAGLIADKKRHHADEIKHKVSLLKQKLEEKQIHLSALKKKLEHVLYSIPNFPDGNAPDGNSSRDNVEVFKEDFNLPKPEQFFPHWEIMQQLDIFDQKRAGKITGAMFAVLKGSGAKLLRSLIAFAFDVFESDYMEFVVPSLVNTESFKGTGHLPKFATEAYHVRDDDFWAIPSGEVPLTAMHGKEILDEKILPLKYMTCTPCFRREAGAAGQETRGIQRLHEFYKLELVKICKPSHSAEQLQSLLQDALKPIKQLKLPYRVVDLCAKDLTFSSARVYDIEVYAPGVKSWLEVSSVGLFTDYQSRRLQIRFREGKKTFYPHTLNGSGLATPRVLAAILENYQQTGGKVKVPSVLVKYMGSEYL